MQSSLTKSEQRILEIARHISRLEDELERAHLSYRQLLQQIGRSNSGDGRSDKKDVPAAIRGSSMTGSVLKVLVGKKEPVSHKVIAAELKVLPKAVRSVLWYLKQKKLAHSISRDRWVVTRKKGEAKS